MKKLLKSLITLILLITLVGCDKEEEIQNEQISSDFQYSINSKIDLLVIKNVKDDKDELNKYNFLEINNNNLYVKNDYLTKLELGKNIINITLSNINYTFELLITNEDKPYVVNYLDVNYIEDKDLNLELDMMEYSFHSLSANKMNEDDYNFNNNRITVYKDYLNKEFNEEREELVLMIMYQDGNDYYNTFITIKK